MCPSFVLAVSRRQAEERVPNTAPDIAHVLPLMWLKESEYDL